MISFDQVMVKLAAIEDVPNLGYYKTKVEEELNNRVGGIRGVFLKRRVLSKIREISERDQSLKDDKSINEDNITKFLFEVEKVFDQNGIDSSNIEHMRKEVLRHSKRIRDFDINRWTGFFKYILYNLVDDVMEEFEHNDPKMKMEHTHRYLNNLINAYRSDFNESVLNRGFLEHFGVFKEVSGESSKSHLAEYVVKNTVKIKRMINDPETKISQRSKDAITQLLSAIKFIWDLRTESEIDRDALDKLTFLGKDFFTYFDTDVLHSMSKGTTSSESVTEIPKYILLRQVMMKLKKLPENDMSVKSLIGSIGLFSVKSKVISEFHNDKFNAFAKKHDVSLHDIISPTGDGAARLVSMMNAATKSNDLDKETRILFDRASDEIKSVNSAYKRYERLMSDKDPQNNDEALSFCLSAIKEALRVIGHGQKSVRVSPPPPPKNPPPPPPKNPPPPKEPPNKAEQKPKPKQPEPKKEEDAIKEDDD